MSRVAARSSSPSRSSSASWRLSSRAAATGAAPAFPALIPQPLAQAPERGAFALGPEARIVVRSRARDAVRVGELLAAEPATGDGLPPARRRDAPRWTGDVALALVPGDRRSATRATASTSTREGVTVARQARRGPLLRHADAPPAPARRDRGRRRGSPGPGSCRAGRSTTGRGSPGAARCSTSPGTSSASTTSERLIDLMSALQAQPPASPPARTTRAGGSRSARGRGSTSHGGRTAGRRGARRVLHAARSTPRSSRTRADRFVEVVPEIDMPGHVNAALVVLREAHLRRHARRALHGHRGRLQLALPRQAGDVRVRRRRRPRGRGADARPVRPHRRRRGARDRPRRLPRFMERVEPIVRAHGKRMMGWEEIGKTRLRRSTVVQHWQDGALAARAVAQGARLVLSPATKAYLDMKYAPGSPLGLSWAGHDDRAGRVRLGSRAAGARRGARPTSSGVEAPLWTETVDDARRPRPARVPAAPGSRRDRVVAGGRDRVAGLPPAPCRARAAARGARRRVLPVARGALALSAGQAAAGDRAEARVQLRIGTGAPVPRSARARASRRPRGARARTRRAPCGRSTATRRPCAPARR